jgi:hypothetical protein
MLCDPTSGVSAETSFPDFRTMFSVREPNRNPHHTERIVADAVPGAP